MSDARRFGWLTRWRAVEAEFDLARREQRRDSLSVTTTREATLHERYLGALLDVGRATAQSIDIQKQCAEMLPAITRVIGAERAIYFAYVDGTFERVLATDHEKNHRCGHLLGQHERRSLLQRAAPRRDHGGY